MSQSPHRLVAKWSTMLNPQTRASIVGADARGRERWGPDSRDTNANTREMLSRPSIHRCACAKPTAKEHQHHHSVSLSPQPPIMWVATKRTRLERQTLSPTRATRAAERATRQQRDDETSRQHHHRRIVSIAEAHTHKHTHHTWLRAASRASSLSPLRQCCSDF